MDRPTGNSNDSQPPAQPPVDPYLYAASLNSFMTERNPIQILVGDMGRMIQTLANLGKNRKMAQQRIQMLQAQVEKVEGDIARGNPKTVGTRLDKLR